MLATEIRIPAKSGIQFGIDGAVNELITCCRKLNGAAVIEKVKNYITRFNGTVTNVDEWGKKRLAYEIQKMREAYYYFIQFEGDSECPNEVERHVRIMESVIRYLCVKQEA